MSNCRFCHTPLEHTLVDLGLSPVANAYVTFDDLEKGEGFDPATVKRIEHLLYVSEYKRRQAPPGVKISSRNFGRDRRYPVTSGWQAGD